MPIPHLSHKIHSPNNWQKSKVIINSRKKSLIKNSLKKKRSFFNFKKKNDQRPNRPVFDIKFPKRKKEGFSKKLKRLIPYFIVFCLVILITGIGAFAWYSKDLPDPQKLSERSVSQSTKIYDRTGEHLLYEIHGEQKRTLIPLEEIPSYAVKATLALEDQRFYEHGGFSLWGMFRGVVLRTLSGKTPQGGSTLTQQLIKNAILGNERRITRKIKELVLAYRIEKKYEKDEILQMYFNEIPYGSTAYGIEAASFHYFGKSARDISLAEAAILAALPRSPSYLSPYGSHLDELYGRQQYCLSQMVKLGYITQEEADEAWQEKLVFKNRIEGIEAPHFVFYVKEILSEKYGDKLIEQGGFKIISTLDYDLQKKAEEIITEQAEKNLENYDASNAALVSIDVKTGQILAMVGSKDYYNDEIDGQVNVTIANRQPGSSFKPIVYATAFSRGFVPETVVYDLETVFPVIDGDYIPHNYDSKERGPVTLRTSLAGSLNIPAVKMIYLTGIENVLDLADELEYTTLKQRNRFGLSLVLGGGEVKLLEHVNAFATFARDGKKMMHSAVLKMEDNTGKVLEKFNKPYAQKILEPEIVKMLNNVMSDNNARAFAFGASNYLTLGDRPVAAKTGTTNDYRDAWTIGYTPQIATGVWVGNNDNSEMKQGAAGGTVAAPIWNKFMREVLKDMPFEEFGEPSYEIPNKPMLGGESTGVKVTIDKMSGLLATEATPEHLRVDKLFKQAHSILTYVNKDNPLGPVPSNPEDDEYYSYWEEAVVKWAEKNNIINEQPPTDSDNLHHLGDQPKINFTSINNNQTITSPDLNIEVKVISPKGIKKIEYFIGQKMVATTISPPYSVNLVIPAYILNGEHQLIAKAYDNAENAGESSITINLDREAYLEVRWLEPNKGTTLLKNDFPYTLMISVDDLSKVKKVDFYYKPENDNKTNWINYIESFQSNNIETIWESAPPTGIYKVYPIITNYQNITINGPEITVSVE